MKFRAIMIMFALLLAACGQPATTNAPATNDATTSAAASAAATTASAAGAEVDTAAIQTGLTALATTAINEIDAAIDNNDRAAAQAAFEAFDEGWVQIEDGVKDQSADAYKAIEDAMGEVEDAVVRADTLNATDAKAATAALRTQIETFLNTLQ